MYFVSYSFFLMFLMFVDQHVRLRSHHQFVGVDLEVPQDLWSVAFNHFGTCLPFWQRDFQPVLSAHVPVLNASHLVMASHVYCYCLHPTPYYMLYCFRTIIARPAAGVLSSLLDPCQRVKFQTCPTLPSVTRTTHCNLGTFPMEKVTQNEDTQTPTISLPIEIWPWFLYRAARDKAL